MFIYNFKLDGNNLFKTLMLGILIVILIICIVSIYKVFFSNNVVKVKDTIETPDIIQINSSNYTNVLKAVHDNVDEYVGQNINFTGYVYRAYDFEDNQFVLARDMIINSDYQSLIVGFLCNSSNASNYTDGAWVNVTGQIIKGYYHGDIPVIEIKEIEETSAPADEYVYPPDDDFVPTSALF